MNALFDPQVPIDKFAEVLAESQAREDPSAGVVDRTVYAKKRNTSGFYDVPHSVYFYYIRVNTDGRLEVSHYFYPNVDPGDDPGDPAKWKPIPHTDAALREIITKLAINARPIKKATPTAPLRVRDPAISGERFENIQWEHKAYIAFFIDEVNWKFHEPPKTDAVVFITQGKDGQRGESNWSFFDAMNLDIEMPKNHSTETDLRSAIAFINHMKADDAARDIGRDALGNPLPGPRPTETQLFQFQMYLDVYFANGASKMTVILDPDGNNLGPPVAPP
jgi:hypothetical protein